MALNSFSAILRVLRNFGVGFSRAVWFLRLCFKYKKSTMAPFWYIWRNLLIVDSRRHVAGCVVECGVWRGGMSAAMAEALGPDRQYFLFDSFEGLPQATDEDGEGAKAYQLDVESPAYHDNCRAPIDYAEQVMKLSGVPEYTIVKGWFESTVTAFIPPVPIAILRLDGDWYESTLVVLESLYKYLAPDGIIIVDDYYSWDGCSRAVHDFMSKNKLATRIKQQYGICVLVKLK